MASGMAQEIVRDVLLATATRSNERDVRLALHNVDAGLAEIRDVLLDCDSDLSAYGHGRPLSKEQARNLSQRARALYERLTDHGT
jgi:hypothetical protein